MGPDRNGGPRGRPGQPPGGPGHPRKDGPASDPKDEQAQFDLCAAHADLGESLSKTGQPKKRSINFHQSLPPLETLIAASPGNAEYQRGRGLQYSGSGMPTPTWVRASRWRRRSGWPVGRMRRRLTRQLASNSPPSRPGESCAPRIATCCKSWRRTLPIANKPWRGCVSPKALRNFQRQHPPPKP